MAKKIAIRLTHYSFLEGAEGVPGAIIKVDDTVAKGLVERGGAVVVETQPAKNAKTATKPLIDVEKR